VGVRPDGARRMRTYLALHVDEKRKRGFTVGDGQTRAVWVEALTVLPRRPP
jgi:hypothetical protein